MVHITLKHDNLTALGAEAFAILTGLAPLDIPGRSTATGPAGVFDDPRLPPDPDPAYQPARHPGLRRPVARVPKCQTVENGPPTSR